METIHYRQVAIGADQADAVTVGIETDPEGRLRAAVWWPSKGDVDSDEAEYDDVGEALQVAEAARALHGFAEVVVTLSRDDLWQAEWGTLSVTGRDKEPVGDIRATDLSSGEALRLAEAIEAERDA